MAARDAHEFPMPDIGSITSALTDIDMALGDFRMQTMVLHDLALLLPARYAIMHALCAFNPDLAMLLRASALLL